MLCRLRPTALKSYFREIVLAATEQYLKRENRSDASDTGRSKTEWMGKAHTETVDA